MDKPSDNWYVRASSMGALMSKGRGKGNEWGETSLGVIRDAVLLNKYGVKTQIVSKYLDKGIINEPQAIEMMMNQMKWTPEVEHGHMKKTRLFNDYVTGEPDLYFSNGDEMILGDVKCSFSASTFPLFHEGDLMGLNKGYYFQMMTYMFLCDVKKSYLSYCLTDTPAHIINDEVQRRTWKAMSYPENHEKSMDDIEQELSLDIQKEMTFSQIPESSRVRTFVIEYDEEVIEQIKNRVIQAREKYDEIYKQF